MVNRTEAPLIKDAIDYSFNLKPYEHFILDNNINVYAVQVGEEDVLQMELVFNAGNWYESKNLIAPVTNYLLKNGTQKKTAYEVNEQFEYYGAYLNRHCYHETATIKLHTLSKHIKILLPFIAELVTDANFLEEELEIYRQQMKQRLEVNLTKADFVSNRLIDEYLYSFEHPYGRYTTLQDINSIDRIDLEQFYKAYYTNGRCAIFIAGKLPANIAELLNQYLGSLPVLQKESTVVQHVVKASTQKKYRIQNNPQGVQGAVRIARPIINKTHPDYINLQVLNTIFGGYFGSRLMSNIREEKGYTYGIHSYLQSHLHGGAWMVSTEAGADVSEATVTEVFREMELLRSEPVDAEELLLVKNYLLGSLLGDLDGPFHIIARWKEIISKDLPANYFDTTVKSIKAVQPEQLQQLAQQYLQPEAFYDLIVV